SSAHHTLYLHDALPICRAESAQRLRPRWRHRQAALRPPGASALEAPVGRVAAGNRGLWREVFAGVDEQVLLEAVLPVVQLPIARSEEHTSELQSRENIV